MNVDNFDAFPWDDNLKTGIESIDEQHKVLVDMLNELASNLVLLNEVGLNDIFNKLLDYANMHFEHEETIWKTYLKDDALFLSHQSTHAFFNSSIADLKAKSDSNTFFDSTEKIVKYLIRWLAFHIIDSDKRMAATVKAIQDGASIVEAKAIADKKMNASTRILIESLLNMYDGLSSRTIELIREKKLRKDAEKKVLELESILKNKDT